MSAMSTSLSPSSTTEADTKISNDLAVLRSKMDLLDSMLHPTDAAAPKLSVKTNVAMRAVVGYLDACGPRMIELVTACMSQDGILSEAVFGEVLTLNDRLQKLLTDVDTRMLTETEASTTVASAAGAASTGNSEAVSGADLTDQFGDLLLGNEDPFAEAQATGGVPEQAKAGAKTTGETSEDFDFFAATPAPAAPTATTEAAKDPFDDFFAERTGN